MIALSRPFVDEQVSRDQVIMYEALDHRFVNDLECFGCQTARYYHVEERSGIPFRGVKPTLQAFEQRDERPAAAARANVAARRRSRLFRSC